VEYRGQESGESWRDRDRPLRGRVEEIDAIGESPDKKVSIEVWFIGISGISVTSGLCTLKSRNVKPRRG
jgi:hypothetical protein